MKRRDFLKGVVGSASAVSLPISIFSSSAKAASSDYKALVVIEFEGGNDTLNMFPPIKASDPITGFDHNTYSRMRPKLAVSNTPLGNPVIDGSNPYWPGTGGDITQCYTKGYYDVGNEYIGINGLMPELALMYKNGDLATINNIGTLISPYVKGDPISEQPPQLMGHNNQRKLQHNGNSEQLFSDGWASRVHQAMGSNASGPNVSFDGSAQIMQGGSEFISLNPNKPDKFNSNSSLDLSKPYNQLHDNKIGRLLGDKIFSSVNKTTKLVDLWDSLPLIGNNVYGGPLFEIPGKNQTGLTSSNGRDTNDGVLKGSILNGLSSVARLIEVANGSYDYYSVAPNRQIFFVKVGGLDHHTRQDTKHAAYLRELSLAIWDFKTAMESKSLWSNVLVLSQTDFGRTGQENNGGTDHAWASHQFLAGGAVSGNQTYHKSNLPTSLTLGGEHDISEQGRYIPTTSIDQLFATAASWYGLDDNLLDAVFPTLSNFRNSGESIENSLIPGLINGIA
ncbi:DUF1501 domain-containing protein [Vibrio mediterranei]|uniref:DUF1501 domain-containing protein n=1 Tax=Vibrio mediterranei TaxID=689 RepID=UPI0038CE9C6F